MCLHDHKVRLALGSVKIRQPVRFLFFFSLFAWGKLLEIIKLMFPSSFPLLLPRSCYVLRITKTQATSTHWHVNNTGKWIIEVKKKLVFKCFFLLLFWFVSFSHGYLGRLRSFLVRASRDFMMHWNSNKKKPKRETPIIHISRCATIREGKNNDKLSQSRRHQFLQCAAWSAGSLPPSD